ncbi:SDR family NAD(P)-dependent oxidoreductase [Marinobacter sp. X15-166B]|uniref:SDR family NAD(P)-dependent oxidoreductase n=1 Tax=Marinobacter sp. X15-166B TaxID=1897620 RepID=UPI00085C80B3|nr:SDR family NAD(P)-dependent oxidoreductase [Marinobacter sp. X15-166B]OEY66342.1 2,5-dichloro-2,5-cyclohexadiene-1,4-diol dehydrogenase [Marinobacter sp. X15-166B]
MTQRLANKVAIVTGGGTGIGAATATRMAEEGATVVVFGRREAPLKDVVASIVENGGKADYRVADVSDEAAFVSAIDEVVSDYGKLDIMVNNAAAFTWGALTEMTTEDWHANFKTTVDGTFWGTRRAMQLMQKNGGSIVNLSSICGVFGTAWMSGYSAAKAAVTNFSRAAASEGAAANIRCNVVIPGVIETDATAGMLSDDTARANTAKLIPLQRVGHATELANAVLFLASDEASYITGATLAVDGGRSSDLYTAMD